VFAAETIIIIAIILPLTSRVKDGARKAIAGRFDFLGVVLSALAMGLVVLALVTANTWGLVRPINPPFEVFGFSPVIPIVLLGLVVARLFFAWERRVATKGRSPLIGTDLLHIRSLRSGLGSMLVLYFTIAGTFFILPLYLQTVLGLDAFESGVRILPMSIAIFVMALVGSRLGTRFSPRLLVQLGLGTATAGVLLLIGAITPDARGTLFAIAMAIIGIGLGLAVSQIGNINLSAAEDTRSSEIGGLQGTAQNLGSSLGVAIAGTVLFIGLATTFTTNLADQPAVNTQLQQAADEAVSKGVQVVPASRVEAATQAAGLPPDEVDAVVTAYSEAKIESLRAALAIVFVAGLLGLLVTGGLPKRPLSARGPPAAEER
jgi:Na+/melibiose symporter-like transporter